MASRKVNIAVCGGVPMGGNAILAVETMIILRALFEDKSKILITASLWRKHAHHWLCGIGQLYRIHEVKMLRKA